MLKGITFLTISLFHEYQSSVYWLRSPVSLNSYERAYGKLLDNMLLGDLSLKANIGGTELLIFPSDKLPERIQREFFANVAVSWQDCSLPPFNGFLMIFYRLEWFTFFMGHFLCPERK